jgi:hypothetical protein
VGCPSSVVNLGTTHAPCLSNGLDTMYEWATNTDAGKHPSDSALFAAHNAK